MILQRPSQRAGGARARLVLALALSLPLFGCGSDRDTPRPPGPSPGPPSPDDTVNGTERLGWEQQFAAGTNAADYRFAAYVDGARAPLDAAACTPPAAGAAVASCESPLPSMTAGRHTLELVASRRINGAFRDSAKSAPLVLMKVDARVSIGDAKSRQTLVRAEPWLRSRSGGISVEVVADVGAVADLAAAPDGRLFVAERSGRVRIVQGGRLASESALILADSEEIRRDAVAVFALALHPDFERTHLVYVGYATESAAGPLSRVVRYREVAGRFGEAAVLLEEANVPRAGRLAMRFGPDRKLYVAFAGGDARSARATYAGRILRLEEDGTTPNDSAGASPVLSAGHGAPFGLAWPQGSEVLLELDRSKAGVLHLVSPAGGSTLEARAPAAYAWEPGIFPSSLVSYAGTAFEAWNGDLLVGMFDGGIQRFQIAFFPSLRLSAAGPRLARAYGAVGALAVGQDGTVYAATANGEAATGLLPAPASSLTSEYVLRLSPLREAVEE